MRREHWENTMKFHWEDTMQILIQNPGLSKNGLFRKSGYGNKNSFFKFLKQWEKDGLIGIKQSGKEKLVFLSHTNEKINQFIEDFGIRLDNYKKLLNKHLISLEKNLPIINPRLPMKIVKMKRRKLEFDKKNNIWKPTGKYEADNSNSTWNLRKKPLMHFETILNILNRLYQESSVITFGMPLFGYPELIHDYQTTSQKLISDTVQKLENVSRKNDDYPFVITRIRMVLYGLVYKATLEAKMKS